MEDCCFYNLETGEKFCKISHESLDLSDKSGNIDFRIGSFKPNNISICAEVKDKNLFEKLVSMENGDANYKIVFDVPNAYVQARTHKKKRINKKWRKKYGLRLAMKAEEIDVISVKTGSEGDIKWVSIDGNFE